MILLARGTCGIGFIGLCLNALLPEPSLLAIYLLGLWDGFSHRLALRRYWRRHLHWLGVKT
ncbi:hypothetical protein ECZU03_38080 [Escherichia coli]|nr:hypothetical protein ECZU03_38080 [Escherichia coli]